MKTSGTNDILVHLKSLFSNDEEPHAHKPLTEYFPAIIYVYDADSKKLRFVNEGKLNEALGFSMEDVRGWDHDFFNMVFKDDLEMVQQEMERFNDLEDDDDHSYNLRFNHKEGDWRYFRARGTVLKRNETGNPASLIFVAEDITVKMKSEQEVTALKQLIDDTEELLRFGSWSWDIRINKLYWTDGMYQLLGYIRKDVEPEVSLRFYMKHISPKDAVGLRRVIRKAIDNRSGFEYTYTLTTRHKEEKIVSTIGKIVTFDNGQPLKIIGITRDVTIQIKTNRDLVHYKEMILEKEEFLNQGSWETNVLNGDTTWSKGMYRLFGYDPETDMGHLKVTKELHLTHMSEEEARRSAEDWKAILKNKDVYNREASITTKDGIIRQLETYGKVLRDNNGMVEKVIGTTRDVTRIREYEKSLEEKIQELNRSNTELEEFAYIASHDLQEPLRKLTTFSERLQSKFAPCLGKEGLVYLDRIVAATENMRILIENLLEFSRTARSGKHFTSVSLAKLLAEVEADLELQIEETGTKIIADPLPTLDVIPSQIKQLFNNLLSNAVKFRNKQQQAVITISTEKLPGSEKSMYYLKNEKSYYKITIKDNGIGFEKEYAEKIFQIFQRLHGRTEYPGSGIGLAICKKIVENHSGVIFATGNIGDGAAFTVILPETQSH